MTLYTTQKSWPAGNRAPTPKGNMDFTIPSQETIGLIASVLRARETPVSELAAVIAAIRDGISFDIRKNDGDVAVLARKIAMAPQALAVPKTVKQPKIKLPKAPKAKRMSAPPAFEKPLSTITPIEPPHARLLRRADVISHEAARHPESVFAAPVSSNNSVRGIVKWFDSRSSKGALRLMGISADVPLTPDVMAGSGLKRLYKDQEIQATMDHRDGHVKLLSLSLPGRSNESNPFFRQSGSAPSSSAGSASRHTKEIGIQIKHDLSRQRQARAAAENLLGKLDLIKTS